MHPCQLDYHIVSGGDLIYIASITAAARFNVLQNVYFLSKPLLEKKSGIQMTRDPQTLHEILNSSTADQDDFLLGMSLVLEGDLQVMMMLPLIHKCTVRAL